MADVPDAYLVEHVRDALAHDPALAELHLDVTVAGGDVFVSGTVATQERREAVSRVLAELLPDRRVHNETSVEQLAESPETETLR